MGVFGVMPEGCKASEIRQGVDGSFQLLSIFPGQIKFICYQILHDYKNRDLNKMILNSSLIVKLE